MAPESEELARDRARLEQRVGQLQAEIERLRRAQGELFQTIQRSNQIPLLSQELNTLDRNLIYEICVERIRLVLQATSASLYIHIAEDQELRLAAQHQDREIATVVRLAEATDTVMARAVESKRTLFAPDIAALADRERLRLPHRDAYTTTTCISAPLLGGGRVMGVLNFSDRVGGPFSEMQDAGFVDPLCQMVGVGLSNLGLHEQVQLQAKLDTMTGLYSHTTFFEEVEKEITRSTRYGSHLSLIMVDIDDFKHFNDNYGHQAGDVVIIDTADIVKDQVRTTDIPGRYGGDEFAVILPETDIHGAYKTAMRIRNRIKEHAYAYEGQELNVCISVGVCQWLPGMTLTELVELGDEGLYKSKRAGKDQVQAVGEAAAQLTTTP